MLVESLRASWELIIIFLTWSQRPDSTSHFFLKLRKYTMLLSATFLQHEEARHPLELMCCKLLHLHFKSKRIWQKSKSFRLRWILIKRYKEEDLIISKWTKAISLISLWCSCEEVDFLLANAKKPIKYQSHINIINAFSNNLFVWLSNYNTNSSPATTKVVKSLLTFLLANITSELFVKAVLLQSLTLVCMWKVLWNSSVFSWVLYI